MKHKLIHIIALAACAFALVGCSGCSSFPTSTAKSLTAVAILAAANHYNVSDTDTKAIIAASDSLFGIAAIAQANLGKTPAQANIATGAATPAIGQAVQEKLPDQPITQDTVSALLSAATKSP